jgi:FlaA1/EpsC-like NDP-sugar epimerase
MPKITARTALAALHDVVATAVAWTAAFWLRFNLDLPQPYLGIMIESLVWIVPLQALIFWSFGLYRGIWRYASTPDLKRILLAVGIAALASPAIFLMLQIPVPRSVLVLDPVLLVLIMGGSRFAYRMWKEQDFSAITGESREPVVVIGAEEAAVNLIKDLARSAQWRVAAVFDDDRSKLGRRLQGVSVVGRVQDIPQYVERIGVRNAIIAMPAASHSARRSAVQICRDAGLQVMTVPSYDDLVSGKVTVSQIRHVELDDLLGRDPVVLDNKGLSGWINDRTVMITGAGGSIGSELCRQLARYHPRQLLLFEASEFALYNIEQEFRQKYPSIPIACAIGDIKDSARIEHLMQSWHPSAVFHSAAYKHVPLMESNNAWQTVLNNVAGTHAVAQAANRYGVEKFVLISTDKAINPTSVMGASKRLAELVCQALQRQDGTRYVTVRFGNVLGSTGSVIPKFREQIAMGGPVTVTHREVRRYFMSIQEAAQLVLQAGLMGNGGEIYVLDMGEPVLISDLARDLIRLSGFTENEIRIEYTGLRPGEKLYEELLANDENTLPTPHPKLRIAKARPEGDDWLPKILAWMNGHKHLEDSEVRRALARWLPEYQNS